MTKEETNVLAEVLFKMDFPGEEWDAEKIFKYNNRARALASRGIGFLPKEEAGPILFKKEVKEEK